LLPLNVDFYCAEESLKLHIRMAVLGQLILFDLSSFEVLFIKVCATMCAWKLINSMMTMQFLALKL